MARLQVNLFKKNPYTPETISRNDSCVLDNDDIVRGDQPRDYLEKREGDEADFDLLERIEYHDLLYGDYLWAVYQLQLYHCRQQHPLQ